MPLTHFARRRRPPLRPRARLRLEPLESRHLLSVYSWPGLNNPVYEVVNSDTLTQARDLLAPGVSLNAVAQAGGVGTVGDGPAGAADVDWFRFQLSSAAVVNLTTLGALRGTSLSSVLSLYGDNPNDPTNPTFAYRLLAQDDGANRGGDAFISQVLGPGTYYVAVSGTGNRYFHPLLAGSGYDGSIGDYGLRVTSVNLSTVPPVLSVDPAPGAVLGHSPLVIRVRLSAPLAAGQTLTLRDGNDNPVTLAATDFSAAINEMRLILSQPLGEGAYRVSLRDGGGQELFGSSFTINAVEGTAGQGTAGNDIPATASNLGDLTGVGTLRLTGVIGDDPFYTTLYDPNVGNQPSDTANDVDFYRFTISGAGTYAFQAEVLAGRIGSPLNPGLSLFWDNAGQLELVRTNNVAAANDNTYNRVPDANGNFPLEFDAFVFGGLTAGTYYLAVSSSFNVHDPLLGLTVADGLFDPNSLTGHTGSIGSSTGDYVLNLRLSAPSAPPQVVSASLLTGSTPNSSPTFLVVQFSQPVNLQTLAYLAYEDPAHVAGRGELPAVFIDHGGLATPVYPRLVSYDTTTNTATFLMLDRLPNSASAYELHLSGANGLTDFAGNALVANHGSGDFVVTFNVNAVLSGNDLGVLFPRDLAAAGGVVVTGSASPTVADDHQFQVQQLREYLFTLNNASEQPIAVEPLLFEVQADGSLRLMLTNSDGALGNAVRVQLTPGITYVVRVANLPSAMNYRLHVTIQGLGDNPQPLVAGPAPALRIRLATAPSVPQTASRAALPLPLSDRGSVTAAGLNISPQVAIVLRPSVTGATTVAAGPIGGSGTASGGDGLPTDRQLAQGASLSLLEALLSVTLLAQPGGDADPSDIALEELTGLLGDYLRGLGRSWQQALEFFFATGARMQPPAPAMPENPGPAPEQQPEDPGRQDEEPEAVSRPEEPGPTGTDWTGAAGLLALGGSLLAERRQKRKQPIARQ